LIPRSTVDTIINTARIDEVIGDFVVLKKRGVNLMACCPFHGEKSPSFSVSVTKGIYKCFGCGRAGNAVTFIMEHESMTYVEALRYLAKKYNIEVVEDNVNPELAKAQNTERDSVFIALNYAAKYFNEELLNSEEGQNIGLSYFKERGYRDETIAKFQLGYSHENRTSFYNNALKNGLTEEFLIKAGLVSKLDNGEVMDRYRGRVIFPIYNLTGKIIAFAGRILKTNDKVAKYVNSPETIVYHKSEHLYGLHLAKTSIKKSDLVYLVEGYTDVITLVQSGVENVVASSGTSLTEGQIKLVTRFTKNITVLYDGDAAGIKAALRGIDMLLAEGMNVKVVLFPDKEDPDSYCKKVGGTAFEEYIHSNAKDFIVFKSQLLLDEVKLDIAQRSNAIHNIVESISKIPDPITRSLYAAESSKILMVEEQLILTEINKQRNTRTREQIPQVDTQIRQAQQIIEQAEQLEKENTRADFETGFMRLLLKYGAKPYDDNQNVIQHVVNDIVENEFELENEAYKKILKEYINHIDDLAFDSEVFFKSEDPEISKTSIDLVYDFDKFHLSPNWQLRQEITVLTPDDNYKLSIDKSYTQFKIHRIGKIYKEIKKEFDELIENIDITGDERTAKENELMATQMKVKQIELGLGVITGTVISR
jgi:DNA primase